MKRPNDRSWQTTAVGLGIVALVLIALALMLAGSGSALRGYDATRVGSKQESVSRGETLAGAVLLLLVVAHAALSLQPTKGWVDRDVREAGHPLMLRYGIDLDVLRPRLATLLPEQAAGRLERDRWRTEIALTAWWAYVVAAALAALLLGVTEGWPAVLALVPFTSLVLAYSRFAAARAATRRHAETLAATVELHRFDILSTLRQELPRSSAEEREVNLRVAKFLHEPGELKPSDFEKGDTFDLVYHHPPELEAAAIGDEVRELRDALAEPTLTNWSGNINVRFENLEDGAEGARGPLIAGRPSRALIAFGSDPLEGWESCELEVSGGTKAPTAEFRVMFDSDAAEFPIADVLVVVRTEGNDVHQTLTFKAPTEPGVHPVWITIFQGPRVIESLETELNVKPS